MFYVFENGQRADSSHINILPKGFGWDKSEFETFDDALEYAIKWLGDYEINKALLKLNIPYEYYEDATILISDKE